VGSTKQDNRSIVRKRTQQLVYLELGRDNGGVMLNLSEEGCSFQAITPVKVGETRFAFQISGGRRIAGDAEIVWVDDVGIMGGLRFLNLPVEARKQIRLWLQETNAPEEHGAAEPAASAPVDTVARGQRAQANGEAESREYRSAPFPGPRTITEEAPAPAWAHLRAASSPPMSDQFAMPPMRADGTFVVTRARSVSVGRSLVVMALGAVIALIVVFYQHELGGSLIWLGETISGKTKASSMLPETKTTPTRPTNPPVDTTAPRAPSELGGTQPSPQNTDEQKTESAANPAKAVPETALPADSPAAKPDPPATSSPRQESVLEKQALKDRPEVWDSTETVESLWGAVQAGSVSAERSLAERFVRGEGVLKNCEQAKVLLRAAANKGSREARLRLYELETQGCH